jgi:hypothetical protein
MLIRKLIDVKDGEFDLLPAGKYQVGIIEADEIAAKEKEDGTMAAPKLKIKFKILSGENMGRYIFKDFILTEKALWALKPFIIALGYPQDRELDISPEEFIGQQLIIRVGHRIFNSQTYIDIKEYQSLGSLGIKKIINDEDIPF